MLKVLLNNMSQGVINFIHSKLVAGSYPWPSHMAMVILRYLRLSMVQKILKILITEMIAFGTKSNYHGRFPIDVATHQTLPAKALLP